MRGAAWGGDLRWEGLAVWRVGRGRDRWERRRDEERCCRKIWRRGLVEVGREVREGWGFRAMRRQVGSARGVAQGECFGGREKAEGAGVVSRIRRIR